MQATVRSTTRLTPSMIRIVLGGGDLAGFEMPADTDTYVNLSLPQTGGEPARRRYTVRAWDETAEELTLDFVVHGDEGVAGPWAARAEVGDVLEFTGPGSGYRPDPAADWHLLVGDESALPAIAASLVVIPEGALTVVRLLCDGPEHEVALDTSGALDLQWLHRTGDESDVDLLVGSVRELAFPRGRVHAFVHGEADEVRALRRHLLTERGLDRKDMSCSPYWRRTMTDEDWRRVKRDFVAAMEADLA